MGSTTPDQTAIIPPKLIKISEIERKPEYINSWKQNPSQLFCFCLATITFLCFNFMELMRDAFSPNIYFQSIKN